MAMDKDEYLNEVEKTAYEYFKEHIRKVDNSVKLILDLVDRWLRRDKVEVEQTIEVLKDFANDADDLKKEIIRHISSTPTLLQREDMMRIILLLDKTIDYVESAAFHFSNVVGWRAPPTISKIISEIINHLSEMVDLLKESIRLISSNVEKALSYCDAINEIERKIDFKQRTALSKLYDCSSDVKMILKMRDFIYHLEMLSDEFDEIADAIRILALSK